MSWREDLPEDIRESEALKDVEDVGALAQQFIDQGKHLGNSMRLPGENATPEARAEFRQRLLDKGVGLMEVPNLEDPDAMNTVYDSLGRPKTASEYDKPEVEGGAIDDTRFNRIAEAAHKAGISKRQLTEVMGTVMAADGEMIATNQASRDEATSELKTEWGQAFDTKVSVVAKLAELTEAPSGLVDAIKSGTVDAGTLRWLDKLGAQLGGEAAEIINQGTGDSGKITKVEAMERSQEILETLTSMSQSDPRYGELMKKRMQYMEIASG